MARPIKNDLPVSRVTITIRTDWLQFIDKYLVPRGYGETVRFSTNRSHVIENLMTETIEDLMDEELQI
jgi:hypothetical protein